MGLFAKIHWYPEIKNAGAHEVNCWLTCQSVCTHVRITVAGHLNVVKTDQAIKGRSHKHDAWIATKSVPVSADICRVCRSEGTYDKPLYHPCVCTGSIKFIHQEWYVTVQVPPLSYVFWFTYCTKGSGYTTLIMYNYFFYSLLLWLKHSQKEYCELCKHRFAFTPSK